MDQWTKIRLRIRNGETKGQILEETGMHWSTLEKILTHSEPPGYRMKAPRPKIKLGPFLERIQDILQSDMQLPRKQRHTAKRIFERLKEEGYQGGCTVVKDAVREFKKRNQTVYIPLRHHPGEAQVDYGFALVNVSGELKKVAFFVMALPHSDAVFVKAYERECTETFWDGHVQAFEFLGGVPKRITYDNSRVAITNIIGAHARKYTYGFLQLQSHYLFKEHFCCVRRPNEKGVVEGLVKYAHRNFLVPVPRVEDLDELNRSLLAHCQSELKRRLRGKSASKEEWLK